jgi:hypothetical protein
MLSTPWPEHGKPDLSFSWENLLQDFSRYLKISSCDELLLRVDFVPSGLRNINSEFSPLSLAAILVVKRMKSFLRCFKVNFLVMSLSL